MHEEDEPWELSEADDWEAPPRTPVGGEWVVASVVMAACLLGFGVLFWI